jgi:hypothetical protein
MVVVYIGQIINHFQENFVKMTSHFHENFVNYHGNFSNQMEAFQVKIAGLITSHFQRNLVDQMIALGVQMKARLKKNTTIGYKI